MAALNAAWSVLGDPGQRRSYDRALFGEDDAFDSGWDPGLGDQAPMVAGLHSPRFRVSVAVVLLVVLALIFVFTAYAGAPSTP